ncbi:MAG: hypothetical protein IT423_12260 [Pirellulaceae bacterium]|nr:hypothetical protein [Pirellulaceae bacterium]
METSLHRQLKLTYAASPEETEVTYAGYRIDAISRQGELIEIQHAALGALKAKTRKLLDHPEQPKLRIVKPIVARKWIVTRDIETGLPLRRRLSPKRGLMADIFLDLVHFTQLFPHPRLTLEVLLVDLDEDRIPKLEHRFKRKNYTRLEQTLLTIEDRFELRTATDLWRLLPKVRLSKPFDTAELAKQIARPRWFAQKVAYCLRECQAIELVGKQGNNQLYRRPTARRKPADVRGRVVKRPA